MSRFLGRRVLALGGAVAGLFAAALLLAGPALAHASVVSSTPTDGTRLPTAPKAVTIQFDENVGLGAIGYLHVTDQTGKRVDAGAAFHPGGDGSQVTDTLRSGLGDGTYTASFRVISADSHPVAGTIRFVVGNGALVSGTIAAGSSNALTSEVFDAVRWVSYAGFALLGGVWIVLVLWPAGRDDVRARRIVWAGWVVTAVGGLLELLLQGAYAAGDSPARLLDPTLIDATLHSNYGELHSLRLVLLGVLAFALARSLRPEARRASWELGIGAAVVAIAVTFSAGGHGATTSPAWLSVSLDAVHLLSMAVWIGGLVMLVGAVLPRREVDELDATLPAFSTAAFVSVVALVGSGTYAAWRGIGVWHAFLHTTYGLIVLAKILLLAGILAAAYLSRRLVRRRIPVPEDDAGVTTERLRRSVLVEAAVALLVLALSAVLVNEPRGREALAATYREPVSATASLGDGKTVTVTSDPGTHGTVHLTVTLGGATATSVTATATQKQQQIGPIPVGLTRESADTFDGSAALPVAGPWTVDLVVTSSAFDATTTDVTVSLH